MADGEAIASVRDQLLRDRHALLDLSTRNRLLNVPMRAARVRTIEIVDERSDETFRSLTGGRAFSFLPGRQLSESERAELDPDDSETGGIPQPDEEMDEGGLAKRHTDLRLQTRLTSEGLQKRLFDIWYDARTLEEEQGVNVLYLAIGLLRWYDTDTSDVARHAPLLLLPVQLERTSAAEKFKLRARAEPVSPNLTLQAKMKGEFSLIVEDLVDEDEVDVSAYFASVAETVRGKARWEVLPDARHGGTTAERRRNRGGAVGRTHRSPQLARRTPAHRASALRRNALRSAQPPGRDAGGQRARRLRVGRGRFLGAQ